MFINGIKLYYAVKTSALIIEVFCKVEVDVRSWWGVGECTNSIPNMDSYKHSILSQLVKTMTQYLPAFDEVLYGITNNHPTTSSCIVE